MATRNGSRSVSRSARMPIIEVKTVQGVRRKLDRESRKVLGITGDEFLERLNDGRIEYGPDEMGLAALAELVRQEP